MCDHIWQIIDRNWLEHINIIIIVIYVNKRYNSKDITATNDTL